MTIVLDGTNGINTPDLESDGKVLAFGVATSLYPLVSGTAVASTSGTSIDFNSIPSWAKRITVILSGVSTNGTSYPQVQIGSGSVTTTGYAAQFGGGTSPSGIYTSGFAFFAPAASSNMSGNIVLNLIGSNKWVCFGVIGYDSSTGVPWSSTGSSPTLGGTLDRVRITTVNGTDTFDAGSINILYE